VTVIHDPRLPAPLAPAYGLPSDLSRTL
jgi:hypothetical protein